MQIKRVIDNNIICQQRFLNSNIKQILNKRNKRDIKWHFELHNVFYEAWGFFEMFRSFSEGSSSSLLLKYQTLKSWQKSWSLNQNLISLIWAGLLVWSFVQSLPKWPGSPHLQHSSGHVETVAQQSSRWGGSYWMGSNDLATWGLIAGRVKAFWVICWQCLSHQEMSDATSW